ncbi:hypothetical protein Bca52824_034271 [Brassica carinata]|uniref:Superoxide dismutase copper chaperone n=1 Tax=Brassica carinata TaxID=52824 RepID=A0A8X7RZK5_BRACI|nr:hypothetical protein Bca52824_034271 [Brassica carinata]
MAMAPRRKISKGEIVEKLKDDGDFDRLRLQIIRRLKDNEELRNKMISVVKESRALNGPDAQNMKTRQLSDAIFQEVGSKMLSQLSDGLWGIIRSEDGMKNEIRETVQSVYATLSNPGGVQAEERNIPTPVPKGETSSSLLHFDPSSKQKQELIQVGYVQENKGEAACSGSNNNRVSYTDHNNSNCDDEEDPELPPEIIAPNSNLKIDKYNKDSDFMNVNGSKIKAMASILRSVATTRAASAIPIAITFSSSSSSSPTNPTPKSLSFSRSSPCGLRLSRSFSSSPMTTIPASDGSLRQEDGVMPQLLTEFMVDMKCEGCVNAVKSKLETIEGIEKVDVDLANQVVRILGCSPVKDMNQALEQTGRKARLIGQGVPQDFLVSAAVAEFKGPYIFGVVRFAQVSMKLARIEANFTGLSPGNHSWSINEYGDLTNGAASTGNLYNPFQDHTTTEPLGDLGTLEADQSGEAFYSGQKEKLKVADLIGRAVVVYKTEDKKSGPGLIAAVIARSAGVGENYKKLCTCDGTVIWEATNSDFVTSKV